MGYHASYKGKPKQNYIWCCMFCHNKLFSKQLFFFENNCILV